MRKLWKISLLLLPAAVLAAPPTFKKVGPAFVQKHCAECHGKETHKKDLNLEIFRDERDIVKARETWEKVLRKVANDEMPPPKQPRPAPAEREAFLSSIEAVFDAADRGKPPDVGRVVARRLNRTEYNNTIRDLVGVDFKPADDFPSDDIGYGFDNIGDVLTLSPTLMERYLAAAEQVAQRAIIVGELPKPKIQRIESKELSPKRPEQQVPYRPIVPHSHASPESAPLVTTAKLDPREEYNMRTKVFARPAGRAPVRVALLACGRKIAGAASDTEAAQLAGDVGPLRPFAILKTEDVTARRDEDRQYITVKIPPDTERLAVAMVKLPDGEPPSPLYVKYISIEGPLDSRPQFQRKFLAATAGKPQREQTREALERFISRAYRRPATKDEVERVAKLADDAVASGEKWEAGMQRAIEAALVSPKFLFRLEPDPDPKARGPHPIDEFALASRLSYFLWSSMPDEELFSLARQKKLGANLDAQVRRMLRDPKAEALVENFALQWLQLRRLETFRPDRQLFPAYSKFLRDSMLQETRLFIGEIMREDRSVLDMINADFTYVNEALAGLYGVGGVRGPEFVRVALKDNTRGGLLTQASVLAATSNPTRTSPVKRGRWLLEQVLGQPQPPPLPNVAQLPEDAKTVASGTLRQRMEQHRADPNCASCHARMDPLGFALENFNAIGAYRTRDGNFPVDTRGDLPDGTTFNGPIELKALVMKRKDQFARSLAEHMLTYALGRGLEYYDRRTVDRIVAALQHDNYRFSTLVAEIAKSDPFRLRRGKE